MVLTMLRTNYLPSILNQPILPRLMFTGLIKSLQYFTAVTMPYKVMFIIFFPFECQQFVMIIFSAFS